MKRHQLSVSLGATLTISEAPSEAGFWHHRNASGLAATPSETTDAKEAGPLSQSRGGLAAWSPGQASIGSPAHGRERRQQDDCHPAGAGDAVGPANAAQLVGRACALPAPGA